MFGNLLKPGLLAWLITSLVFLAFSVKIHDWSMAFGLLMLVAITIISAMDEHNHNYVSYAMIVVGAVLSVGAIVNSPRTDLHVFIVPAVLLGGFNFIAGVIAVLKHERKRRP